MDGTPSAQQPEDPFDALDPTLDAVIPGEHRSWGSGGAELSARERESLTSDLADLEVFRTVLSMRNVRGLVFECDEGGDPHFYSWDLLRDTMVQVMEGGEPAVHEPACDPAPDEYVTWDYARGFVDGMIAEGDRG